jgi:HEAT repeat protein
MKLCIATLTVLGVVALTTAGPQVPKKEDIPKYIGQLKSATNARVRADAAEMIAARGRLQVNDVKDAIEPLATAVKSDTDTQVRVAAAKALGEIGADPAVTIPALTEALKDKAVPVKFAAVNALGQIGKEASPAIPALRELAAAKTDKKLSQAANQAIKAIGGGKKKG